MTFNLKDLFSGLFFVTAGLYFSLYATATLNVGSASRMGPGYFPVILGGILVLLGLVLSLRSVGRRGSLDGAIAWRGVLLVGLSPILFAVTVRPLGLIAAMVLCLLVASFSSRFVTVRAGLLSTIGLTLFCLLVFHYGLGVSIDLIGPALRF